MGGKSRPQHHRHIRCVDLLSPVVAALASRAKKHVLKADRAGPLGSGLDDRRIAMLGFDLLAEPADHLHGGDRDLIVVEGRLAGVDGRAAPVAERLEQLALHLGHDLLADRLHVDLGSGTRHVAGSGRHRAAVLFALRWPRRHPVGGLRLVVHWRLLRLTGGNGDGRRCIGPERDKRAFPQRGTRYDSDRTFEGPAVNGDGVARPDERLLVYVSADRGLPLVAGVAELHDLTGGLALGEDRAVDHQLRADRRRPLPEDGLKRVVVPEDDRHDARHGHAGEVDNDRLAAPRLANDAARVAGH